MKQKEYAKLIIDTTTLAAKTRLSQEQLDVITANCKEQLALVDEKLRGVAATLERMQKSLSPQDSGELAITGVTIKRLLQTTERELKTQVEHPVMLQSKQIATLQETLQKLLEKKETFSEDKEFNLAQAQEHLDFTRASLNAQDHTLQAIMQKLATVKGLIGRYTETNSVFMLDQELHETMQKTAILARKISTIEHCIDGHPDLIAQHAEQFAPLCQAFKYLTTKTRLLSLTKDVIEDAAPAVLPEDLSPEDATPPASPSKAPASP